MESSHNADVDVAVVGGGIVGLGAARAVLCREPGVRLVVLEKEPGVARHQTGRNSGVVHAGIYYKPGSMKARLCVAGRAQMKAYAAEKGIPYEECGKLIVALDDQEVPQLEELYRRACANEVPGVSLLDSSGMRDIEPAIRGVAALHSPVTAITDYAAVARAYVSDIEAVGGKLLCGFKVAGILQDDRGVVITSAEGDRTRAKRAIVCAGLYSDKIAALAGDRSDPYIVPFRGNYYRLQPDLARVIRGLIYPVPDPDLPFLGVHLTRTIGGDLLVGPNAVLAGAREGYGWRHVNPIEFAETIGTAAFWRFARRYWRVGFAEMLRASSKRRFAADAAKYLPGVRARHLRPAPSGVRAQALDAAGAMVDDFSISRVGLVTLVRNAPSPAATASLPIGDLLADLLARSA